MKNLLIVEDDEGAGTQLKWGLSKEFKVTWAKDGPQALGAFSKVKPKVMTLDLGLPPHEDGVQEGIACLKKILEISPYTKIIVITGNSDKENALQAVGLGAYDFYQKPVDLEVLNGILRRAFHLADLEQEYRKLKKKISESNIFEKIIGDSPGMLEVFSLIKKVASADATVLIYGESGTGKELVAQAIHSRSPRSSSPFIPVNCGAIPENLIESELFGHEQGAFTDAKSRKLGLVERASGGTLFLDEIGELPLQLQVKMLRFLQERKIQRVGGTEEIEVDVRIIAATNVDIEKSVKEGSFREDLFFRLCVIKTSLPPLRERGEDIAVLAKSFLSRFNRKNKKKIKGFSHQAILAMQTYYWPGNVRELENKIQRAVIMTETSQIEPKDLSLPGADNETTPSKGTLKQARTTAEIIAIRNALILHAGNISNAAKELGVSRPTLYDLINKYDLKNFSAV